MAIFVKVMIDNIFVMIVLLMYFNNCKDFFRQSSLADKTTRTFVHQIFQWSLEQNRFNFYLELNYTILITRKLQNTVPAIALVADVFPFFPLKSCSKLSSNGSFEFCSS